MNGLEAIKAMMEGRLVARWIYFGGQHHVYDPQDTAMYTPRRRRR